MNKKILQLLTLCLSECIATSMLLFFGCMGVVNLKESSYVPNHFTIILGFGLVVMLIVNIFGMVSGAHLNPAVTLAAYIYKLVDIPTAIAYVIGQMFGGYLGYGLLRLLTPQDALGNNPDDFCVSLPSVDIKIAFWVEFFMTMALILLCCGVWDPRNKNHHDSVPLRFGLAISALALVGGPFSGGSMNPARSFGPALYTMNFRAQWIYWVAPLSSALITAFLFRAVFFKDPEAEAKIKLPEELPLRDVKNNQHN